MRFTASDVAAEIRRAIFGFDEPVAIAATKAVKQAGERVKTQGRADIARGGFGARWQNAWRVLYYPKGNQTSIDAAAWAYHKIPYADIFESGGTIPGSPTLWIPLRNAPTKFAGKKTTPQQLISAGVKLFMIRRPGRKPLLATNMFVSRGASKKTKFAVSTASLRRAASTGKAKGNQVKIAVPLFVGVPSVSVKARFHLARIAEQQRDNLAEYYYSNLKV